MRVATESSTIFFFFSFSIVFHYHCAAVDISLKSCPSTYYWHSSFAFFCSILTSYWVRSFLSPLTADKVCTQAITFSLFAHQQFSFPDVHEPLERTQICKTPPRASRAQHRAEASFLVFASGSPGAHWVQGFLIPFSGLYGFIVFGFTRANIYFSNALDFNTPHCFVHYYRQILHKRCSQSQLLW